MQRSAIDRTVARLGAGAWLIVPAAFGWATVLDRTRSWDGSPQMTWIVGWVALMLGGAMLLVTVLRAKPDSERRSLIRAGIVFLFLGLAMSALAGWAIVLWTTLYGVGLILFAWGARSQPVAWFMGATFLAATAALIILTLLKVGTPDSYGDYPIAWTTAYVVGALGAAVGMALWPHARSHTTIDDKVAVP